MAVVEIREVTKRFGTQVAVNDLSLDVPGGSIYGFIGPNGSGKTTTLRMIMRILHPDRGEIRVLGQRTLRSASDRVGYLPEERGLYRHMKVRDVLRFFAELKGLRAREARPAIAAWLDRLGLTTAADKKMIALSKGMAQKVQFIATVLARPELILLDEPFSGLDPVNAELMREAVLELRRAGATVIFSTHDMATAETLCDFLFMIYHGRKVLDGTLEAIQRTYGNDTVRVRLEPLEGRDDPLGLAGGHGRSLRRLALAGLPGVVKVNDFGNAQELRLDRGADPQRVLAGLMELGRVLSFRLGHPSLHDIFVRIARPEPRRPGLESSMDLTPSLVAGREESRDA